MFEEKVELENYFKKLDDRNIITLCRIRLKQTGGKALQEKHKCFNCVIIVKIETIFQYIFSSSIFENHCNLHLGKTSEIHKAY